MTLSLPIIIWLLVGISLICAEFVVPGLVIIFFGVGALIVGFLMIFVVDISFFIQTIIFIAASISTMSLLRKYFVNRDIVDLTEEFVGKVASVEISVSKEIYGIVKFKGAIWKAETLSDKPMDQGELVEIVGKDSITLRVRPIKVDGVLETL